VRLGVARDGNVETELSPHAFSRIHGHRPAPDRAIAA
jgi:hypothetical protein